MTTTIEVELESRKSDPFILNLTANIAFRNQFLACTCAFQTDPITDKKEQSKMLYYVQQLDDSNFFVLR